MSQLKNHSDFIQTLEHDDYSGPETKRVSMYGWDAENLQKVRIALNPDGTLVSSLPSYDYCAVTYPDTVTDVFSFKVGGSSGTTVATVTMIYSDSSKESLVSYEKI